jgi:hypothetical protein
MEGCFILVSKKARRFMANLSESSKLEPPRNAEGDVELDQKT